MIEITLNLIAVFICVTILGLLWYKGKQGLVKKIILYLVIEAEKYWGSGMGKIKFTEVMAATYERLPWIIRFFVTTDTLIRWIEDAVEYIKTEILTEDKTIEKILSTTHKFTY